MSLRRERMPSTQSLGSERRFEAVGLVSATNRFGPASRPSALLYSLFLERVLCVVLRSFRVTKVSAKFLIYNWCDHRITVLQAIVLLSMPLLVVPLIETPVVNYCGSIAFLQPNDVRCRY